MLSKAPLTWTIIVNNGRLHVNAAPVLNSTYVVEEWWLTVGVMTEVSTIRRFSVLTNCCSSHVCENGYLITTAA